MSESLFTDVPLGVAKSLDGLARELFTHGDFSMRTKSEISASEIRSAVRGLEQLVREAERHIEVVRADLAANPRHYGTSE